MYIAYTPEQEELRRKLRAYYAELLTPEIREELHKGMGTGATMRAVVRRMAKDGWLGIGWPKEYGGQGRGTIDQFIFFDESMRSGAPVPMLTINTVAPMGTASRPLQPAPTRATGGSGVRSAAGGEGDRGPPTRSEAVRRRSYDTSSG